MKFGKTENTESIDFRLPADNPRTAEVLKQNDRTSRFLFMWVVPNGTAGSEELLSAGTKDELTYYSRQFNSIELNATFYNMPNRNR
jgi:hypothetical protein